MYFFLNDPPTYPKFTTKEIEVPFGDTVNIGTGLPTADTIYVSWNIDNQDKKDMFLSFATIDVTKDMQINFEVNPS